jgi:hypothetical protein
MACSFTIAEIYSETWAEVIMYVIMALTIVVLMFGIYNIVLVKKKRGKFTNLLLLMFYIFTELTLLFRLCLYIYVIISHNETETPCKLQGLAFTLQDLPDYLYLVSGLCQLFIVVQIIMSWQVRDEIADNESQDTDRQYENLQRHVAKLKKTRYLMLAIFMLFLLTSLFLFAWDLIKKCT